ncbi:hypothetical protein [Nocardia fusca]|uniref:DNA-binding protein n=1 Tax=Nocardia fusca TaxID=941183 RepID=A0ABV3F8F4_9NOCA
MASTVRPDSHGWAWYFGGIERTSNGAGIVVKHCDLAAIRVTDLVREFRRAYGHEGESERILVDFDQSTRYSPKNTIVETTSFALLDSRLTVRLSVFTDDRLDVDQLVSRLDNAVGPLLRRVKFTLVEAKADPYGDATPFNHVLCFSVPTRNKTLQDIYTVAEQICTLFDAAETGDLSRETALDLLRAGHASLLIGHPESDWLDVKSDHYDLATDRGKISLASAVARFCNAEGGGIVLVGMDTKRIPGGELIKSVRPVPIDVQTLRRYRQAIENRLFPFPYAMQLETVETSAGQGLVIVSVPPQDEELKPFLVHGAIVDGRVEGAYISIVRRSGEDSIPISAQQIHSTLAAGRALLRRGQLQTGDGQLG